MRWNGDGSNSISTRVSRRDTSRAICKFIFCFFLFYYANVILGPLNVKTAMEAIAAPTPAEARDATRLEPLVFILFYFYTINVNLG